MLSFPAELAGGLVVVVFCGIGGIILNGGDVTGRL